MPLLRQPGVSESGTLEAGKILCMRELTLCSNYYLLTGCKGRTAKY